MKVWNYMMIMLVLMVFLSFIGLPLTGSEELLNQTGIQINSTTGELDGGDIVSSDWYKQLFNKTNGLLLAAGLGTAVIVGLFTRSFEWKLVILAFFISFVVKFVLIGLSVVELAGTHGDSWLVAIIATIFLPITAMFIFSIVEWFGGGGSGG